MSACCQKEGRNAVLYIIPKYQRFTVGVEKLINDRRSYSFEGTYINRKDDEVFKGPGLFWVKDLRYSHLALSETEKS